MVLGYGLIARISVAMARNCGHAPQPRPAVIRTNTENKMASGIREPTKRSLSLSIDYKQLHNFSSTTLYDSVPKKYRGRFYEVERIIIRRAILHVSAKHSKFFLNLCCLFDML